MMNHGHEGYGIYWHLIEMLASAQHYKLEFNPKRLSFTMRTEERTISSVIGDFDLFIVENGLFWSESLVDRMEKLDEIKRKRAEAGAKGGKSKANAKQMLSKSLANLSREKKRKEKEMKEENIYKSFDHLSISKDEFEKIKVDLGVSKQEIDDTIESIQNYAKNKNYKSLNLTVRKWIKKNQGHNQLNKNDKPMSRMEQFRANMESVEVID